MNYFIVINQPIGLRESVDLYRRLAPFGSNLTEMIVKSFVYGDADDDTLDLILATIKASGFDPVLERRTA